MNRLTRNLILIGACLSCLPVFASFESLGDLDARSRSIGNATAAYVSGDSAYLRNPALLSQYKKTKISLTVLSRGLGLELGDATWALQGGLGGVFALPTLLKGAGVGIFADGFFANNANQATWIEYQTLVGFGLEFIESLAGGVSFLGQGWSLNFANAADTPAGLAPPFAPSVSVGFLWSATENFSLGLSGLNLIRPNAAGLAGGAAYGSRSVILGASFHGQSAGVALDVDFKPDTVDLDFRLGGEGWIGKTLRLGAGLEIIGPSRDLIPSVGFGMHLGPVMVDYAMYWSLSVGGGAGNHILTVSMGLPVEKQERAAPAPRAPKAQAAAKTAPAKAPPAKGEPVAKSSPAGKGAQPATAAGTESLPKDAVALTVETAILGTPDDKAAILKPIVLERVKPRFPDANEELLRKTVQGLPGKADGLHYLPFAMPVKNAPKTLTELGSASRNLAAFQAAASFSEAALAANLRDLKEIAKARLSAAGGETMAGPESSLSEQEGANLRDSTVALADDQKAKIQETRLALAMADAMISEAVTRLGALRPRLDYFNQNAKAKSRDFAGGDSKLAPQVAPHLKALSEAIGPLSTRCDSLKKDLTARTELIKAALGENP